MIYHRSLIPWRPLVVQGPTTKSAFPTLLGQERASKGFLLFPPKLAIPRESILYPLSCGMAYRTVHGVGAIPLVPTPNTHCLSHRPTLAP